METLKARLKALQDLNKPSVEVLLRKIRGPAVGRGARKLCLKCPPRQITYYSVALQEIRQRLHKPKEQFKAYFLALFSDRDYGKVLQSLAKVGKSLREPRSAVRGVPGSAPLSCPVSDAVGLATMRTAVGFSLTFGEVPHLPYLALDPSCANYPFFYVLGLFSQ